MSLVAVLQKTELSSKGLILKTLKVKLSKAFVLRTECARGTYCSLVSSPHFICIYLYSQPYVTKNADSGASSLEVLIHYVCPGIIVPQMIRM